MVRFVEDAPRRGGAADRRTGERWPRRIDLRVLRQIPVDRRLEDADDENRAGSRGLGIDRGHCRRAATELARDQLAGALERRDIERALIQRVEDRRVGSVPPKTPGLASPKPKSTDSIHW